MLLGYNTNGFAHHRLSDAIEIIAELGYDGVGLTPDVNHLDIWTDPKNSEHKSCASVLKASRLRSVVETGSRFLLDPRHKHQPTLISPDPIGRDRRLSFLKDCIGLASGFGSECVSFWSGSKTDGASASELMARLVDGCVRLADYAVSKKIRLAFEPEPGMFIDTMDKFAELHSRVNHPAFGLTVDIGHLVCNGELPVSEHLIKWKDWLWNVHIEDMQPGIHDHLMFGEGSVDFDDVFRGLRAAEYQGMVTVELSRHSHNAVNTARQSIEFLKPFLEC